MSENNGSAALGRCVVYDVSKLNAQNHNRRNKRRKWSGNNSAQSNNSARSAELQRAIDAVVEYGKHVHTMGSINALNMLSNIAAKLRTVANGSFISADELRFIAEEAELAVADIRESM